MDPFSVEITIGRPREEVFAYLADIANHPEFTDHFLVDWHLTREESYGEGAGARFRIKMALNRFPWADVTFTEVGPRLIVERGRTGKFNRIRILATYELEPAAATGSTRVRFTLETLPAKPTDRFLEALGARGRLRRKTRRAMRRLRSILEEGEERGTRATIAGGARKPASAFRY